VLKGILVRLALFCVASSYQSPTKETTLKSRYLRVSFHVNSLAVLLRSPKDPALLTSTDFVMVFYEATEEVMVRSVSLSDEAVL
jgi:hypothetical protein